MLIENSNHVAYCKIEDVFYFFQLLIRGLDGKSDVNQIWIGNLKLDKKNTVFINLIDFSSVADLLENNKGNPLSDYIYERVGEVDSCLEEKVNSLIKDEVSSVLNNDIDYSFIFDFMKYLKASISFNFSNFEIIKKYLERIIVKNHNITYLVLYHSDFIDVDFNYDNAYCFDLNNNTSISKKNILLLNHSFSNLNTDLLVSEIEKEYPDFLEKQIILPYLDSFFRYYFPCRNISSSDEKLLVIAKIVFQLLKCDYQLSIVGNVSSMIKSFLSS